MPRGPKPNTPADVAMQGLDSFDHLEKALERGLGGVRLSLGAAPVGFQREGLLVSILQKGADLAEIVELAFTDGGPLHPSFVGLPVIAQMDVEDACGIELAIAVRKGLLSGSPRVIG